MPSVGSVSWNHADCHRTGRVLMRLVAWHQLEKGGGATPFPLLDLESRDAISIPTAPTNYLLISKRLVGIAQKSIAAFWCRLSVNCPCSPHYIIHLRLSCPGNE